MHVVSCFMLSARTVGAHLYCLISAVSSQLTVFSLFGMLMLDILPNSTRQLVLLVLNYAIVSMVKFWLYIVSVFLTLAAMSYTS